MTTRTYRATFNPPITVRAGESFSITMPLNPELVPTGGGSHAKHYAAGGGGGRSGQRVTYHVTDELHQFSERNTMNLQTKTAHAVGGYRGVITRPDAGTLEQIAVWESRIYKKSESAQRAAEKKLAEVLANLFA
jgi:hypothetical protein